MFSSSSSGGPAASHDRPEWTWTENKKFEKALALYPKDTPNRWQWIANELPRRSVQDVFKYYKQLVEIEGGYFVATMYDDDDDDVNEEDTNKTPSKRNLWTKEEHRLFLEGVNIYGRGIGKRFQRM